MRIRKFTESLNDMSKERIAKIIEDLTPLISSLDDKENSLKKYEEEFNKYKNPDAEKGNDQISDSIVKIQDCIKNIEQAKSLLGDIVENLDDLRDNERNTLYGA